MPLISSIKGVSRSSLLLAVPNVFMPRARTLSVSYTHLDVYKRQGHEYAINYIKDFHTLDPIIADIKKTRSAGADLIALYLHMGEEYLHEPTPYQKEMVRELTASGADMIIGTHSHVPQPLEWVSVELPDGSVRKSLVIYTLGNF